MPGNSRLDLIRALKG